jgi:hypothetical protein
LNENQEPETGAESCLLLPVVALNRLVGNIYISKETNVAPAMPNFSSDLVPKFVPLVVMAEKPRIVA